MAEKLLAAFCPGPITLIMKRTEAVPLGITGGLDTAGINYGIALLPQDDAGVMNSVEVLGFGVPTVATDAEKQAAYRFIQWWNTQDADGSSPSLEWATKNGFPAYTYSVQAKDSYLSSEKLRITSSADPAAPTDFFVDSRFPDTGALLMDVLAPLVPVLSSPMSKAGMSSCFAASCEVTSRRRVGRDQTML